MRRLIKHIVKKLETHLHSKGKYFVITGRPINNTETVPYLMRYFVFRSSFFNIYIHRFLRSDADELHDHPWNFGTYVVEGEYKEHTFYGVNHRKEGSFAYRRSTDFHRVEVDKNRSMDEINEAPLTLFFSGPRKKEWGFMSRNYGYSHAKPRWIPYWEYLKVERKEKEDWD